MQAPELGLVSLPVRVGAGFAMVPDCLATACRKQDTAWKQLQKVLTGEPHRRASTSANPIHSTAPPATRRRPRVLLKPSRTHPDCTSDGGRWCICGICCRQLCCAPFPSTFFLQLVLLRRALTAISH